MKLFRPSLPWLGPSGFWRLVPLALWLGMPSLPAYTLLSSNELVFVNVDHAPMGACSTIAYGYKGEPCGVGTSSGVYPYWTTGGGGVLMGLSGSSGLQVLPFVTPASSISTNARFFPDASIQRSLTPCTDEYTVNGAGLAFTHYTPAWAMADLSTATLSDKKRYFLPATWLVFTIQNTNSTSEEFYFGLPVPVTQSAFAQGSYQGFALGEAALAVQTGSCDVWSGARLASALDGMTNGGAFHLTVPAGQTRSLMVVIAYYRSAVVDSRTSSSYYYTSLYSSIDSVIDSAFAGFGDAQMRCQQLATVMSRAGLNPYRQFLACHALHSYMADSACLIDPQGGAHWWEMEGWFNYINTFDLTVDHAFYDAYMQPWALRNVLDAFSGALPGTGYSFDTPLYSSTSGMQVSSHGFSFYHDMGLWPTSGTGPAYGACMGQEELQAWILSAGLYWRNTADNPWLTNNAALLRTCLDSMLLRDNTNSAACDGITKNVNSGEITTYDNLDASLQRPAFSGRLAVRNWASYLALNAMFAGIGDTADAATCESMAAVAAQTIVNRWNSYHATLGYIPALLDGSDTAAITPMIEGLAYPAAMGLTNAIDRTGGPYASMLQALSNHLVAVLVAGRCLGVPSGGWVMTSANLITWQSKIFICQYAAETVLGITNDSVNCTVDQVHATIQIQAGPYQGWVDATDGTGGNRFAGGPHYPRAVTSALWWLNATNNPAYPVATSAPVAPAAFLAVAANQQVLLLWQGVALATGYNIQRANTSGGPYAPLANKIAGASFTDSGLVNGATYYYILTATNQIGESLPSAEVSATPVPFSATNIAALVWASKLTVAWPPSYTGWVLQTNTLGLSNPAGWGDVPASRTNSQMSFPIADPAIPTEFFRLRHP
ncbi:MAG TPA: glycoside hydrolase family 52 protein [Verrucomicrobiae bacterium]|nr:glycoside hydrolase family 52 protein [Verrucomicrobiae bacterium]